MLYLNTNDISSKPYRWLELIKRIEDTVKCINSGDFMQPIKPYVRYRNLKNRIIAMPGFVGGDVNTAGIKWIASFPENISKGIPRAHSLTVLNNADTGKPVCVINTAIVSAVRTAAVSGLVLKHFLDKAPQHKMKVGICGFGVIGKMHVDMVNALMGDKLSAINVYDKRQIELGTIPDSFKKNVTVVSSWEEAYEDADIFITATVSNDRYINLPPKRGSLQLNVSLRDYQHELRKFMDVMIVDNWDEICRENTDIEVMHKHGLLEKQDTLSIDEVICDESRAALRQGQTVMFNPMGMSAFDISIGHYYYQHALKNGIGILLNDDYDL